MQKQCYYGWILSLCTERWCIIYYVIVFVCRAYGKLWGGRSPWPGICPKEHCHREHPQPSPWWRPGQQVNIQKTNALDCSKLWLSSKHRTLKLKRLCMDIQLYQQNPCNIFRMQTWRVNYRHVAFLRINHVNCVLMFTLHCIVTQCISARLCLKLTCC